MPARSMKRSAARTCRRPRAGQSRAPTRLQELITAATTITRPAGVAGPSPSSSPAMIQDTARPAAIHAALASTPKARSPRSAWPISRTTSPAASGGGTSRSDRESHSVAHGPSPCQPPTRLRSPWSNHRIRGSERPRRTSSCRTCAVHASVAGSAATASPGRTGSVTAIPASRPKPRIDHASQRSASASQASPSTAPPIAAAAIHRHTPLHQRRHHDRRLGAGAGAASGRGRVRASRSKGSCISTAAAARIAAVSTPPRLPPNHACPRAS